jgi:ribosomal protein S18 acetylase RimI-like enzyme
MTVFCRREMPGDEAFLRSLLIDTIASELGADGWPEPLRAQLLESQYRVRRQVTAGCTQSLIVMRDGESAGWLLLADLDDEIRVKEIMVAGPSRGQGIGTAAMRHVLEAARGQGKAVRLLVNVTNARAIGFYGRLGFRVLQGDEVQQLMGFG